MKTKSRVSSTYLQNYRETVGMRIRSLREGKGLSQEGLAEIMNVQRSTISKIETGKFSISIDYLVKFAWYLDFDIIITGKEK